MTPGPVRLFALSLLAAALPLRPLLAADAPARGGRVTAPADARFPAMVEWAEAGVRGGIPRDLPVLATVTPGNDLQVALDITATQGGGVVDLAAGDFVITRPLQLRSGVVLRGAADGGSRLHLKLRGRAGAAADPDGFSTWTTGLHGRGIKRAGLERLTVVFDSSLPPPPTVATEKRPYVNDPGQRDDLWVVSVRFTQSEDCWIDACRIVDSGTHPLLLEDCRHLTVRHTELTGAHNKGGPDDAGCLVLDGSEYTLLDGLTVRDLRHVVLEASSSAARPCRYNVLIRSSLAVDVAMRSRATAHNLVEDCTIELPPGHPWTPFGIGEPKRHQPPGPGNVIHRCRALHKSGNEKRNYSVAEDPAQVYTLITDFKLEKRNPRHVVPLGPAPASGTLYPPPRPQP
ncbi:MAG TPA: hypothetical protein VGD81_02960 [Opitutaceae bacterium]